MEQISPFLAGFRSGLAKLLKEDYFTLLQNFSINRESLLRKYNELLLNKINGFIVLCNFTTGQYEYVSESIKDNLGYDVSDYSVDELTYLMGSIIHDRHVDVMVNSYIPTFCKYLQENATGLTGTDYRSTCCCRLRNIYGAYEWYLLDTAIAQTNETGFPVTTLVTCTNINQFKKDECFYYNIQKKTMTVYTGSYWKVLPIMNLMSII